MTSSHYLSLKFNTSILETKNCIFWNQYERSLQWLYYYGYNPSVILTNAHTYLHKFGEYMYICSYMYTYKIAEYD